jgi:heme A synthase
VRLGALVRQRVDSLVLVHITLAAFVALLALTCAFRAIALHGGQVPLKRTGIAIIMFLGVQLMLGVVALALRPSTPQAVKTTASALWTTAHQANGALLLALCAVLYLWCRRLLGAGKEIPVGEIQGKLEAAGDGGAVIAATA